MCSGVHLEVVVELQFEAVDAFVLSGTAESHMIGRQTGAIEEIRCVAAIVRFCPAPADRICAFGDQGG